MHATGFTPLLAKRQEALTVCAIKLRSHFSSQQRTCPHLCVSWRLLCKSSAIVEVFEFVLLVDFVIAFAPRAACHMLPHPVVPLLLLGGRKASGWEEVKEKHSHHWISGKTCYSYMELRPGAWKIRKVLGEVGKKSQEY